MMQTIVAWFLVVVLPQVVAVAMAGSRVDGDLVVKKRVEVHRVDGDSNGKGQVTVTVDTGDGEGAAHVAAYAYGSAGTGHANVAFVGHGGKDGQVIAKAYRIKNDSNAAKRGWFGVSIGAVPDALASQLSIADNGLLVVNVVEGGPADLAGIHSNDVIISLDGEAVTSDFSKLTNMLADHKPGDTVNVVVLQDGQVKALDVELGSHEAMNKFVWKFDKTANLGEVDEAVNTTGKMITRDEDGEWNVIDLGDLNELEALEGLPENIRLAIPGSYNQATRVFFRDGKHSVKSTVKRDGMSISVSQEDGGAIVVTRKDVDGNETEATYATADDLETADKEAFDIFSKAGQTVVKKLGVADVNFDFNVDLGEDFDIDAMKAHIMVWRQQMADALGDVDEARGKIQDQLEAMLQKLQNGNVDGLSDLNLLPLLDGKGVNRVHVGGLQGQPHQSFEVRPDDTIAVTVRKGDSEVVKLYTNEDDLADRAPKLYEKYLKVVGEDD